MLPFGLFGKSSPEETFWIWFQNNQDDLYNFERDREAVFDRLSEAMIRVHPDLTFEFGPILEDGRREFIISAAGIKEAFSSVEQLHTAAPELEKWIVLKFRQRRFPIHDIESLLSI